MTLGYIYIFNDGTQCFLNMKEKNVSHFIKQSELVLNNENKVKVKFTIKKKISG